MNLPTSVLPDLPTPCLVVDVEAVDRNIERATAVTRHGNVALRPHFKAHKCTTLLRRQVAPPGCVGVTCQTSGEALVLARAGFPDILVAAPVVGRHAGAELAAAARRSHVTVVVDDSSHVLLLESLLGRYGIRLDVLIELDVGLGRCGLPLGSDRLISLATLIPRTPGITFRGLQAYEGHVMLRETRSVRRTLLWQALSQVRHERDRLARAGIACPVISGGGTGTMDLIGEQDVYTEVQAGSYVLMDACYRGLGLRFEPALLCVATLVSRATPELGVLNAGLKALSCDQGMPVSTLPGVRVIGLSDEHARVVVPADSPLAVGDPVPLIPSHLDPTVNLHDALFAYDPRSRRLATWRIDARRTAQSEGRHHPWQAASRCVDQIISRIPGTRQPRMQAGQRPWTSLLGTRRRSRRPV